METFDEYLDPFTLATREHIREEEAVEHILAIVENVSFMLFLNYTPLNLN